MKFPSIGWLVLIVAIFGEAGLHLKPGPEVVLILLAMFGWYAWSVKRRPSRRCWWCGGSGARLGSDPRIAWLVLIGAVYAAARLHLKPGPAAVLIILAIGVYVTERMFNTALRKCPVCRNVKVLPRWGTRFIDPKARKGIKQARDSKPKSNW